MLACATTANAATIHVTGTSDETTPNDGTVSLREAITAINSGASGDPDIFGQSPGSYGTNDTVVVPASSSHYLLDSEIQIQKTVAVQGAGASSSVIDAHATGRVFELTTSIGTGGTVTFQGVTISGGDVVGAGGGGVRADNSSGSAVFTSDVISGNTATIAAGGGGFVGGGGIYDLGGTLTLTNTTVTGNSTTVNSNTSGFNGGGGIYYDGTGALSLNGSTVSNNSASANGNSTGFNGGGGIYSVNGAVSLSSTTVSGNTATADSNSGGFNGGAGIANDGTTLTLTQSSVSANTAYASGNNTGFDGGAGILNNGTALTISSTTIAANTAYVNDTHAFDGGGAVLHNGTTLTVTGSTLSANALQMPNSLATSSGGGAVEDNGSGAVYLNSTLSDNSTNIPATSNDGGGAIHTTNTVKLANVTIAGNAASSAPGGGVYGAPSATVSAKSSIVAQNSAGAGASNCGGSGTYTSQGYNLEDANTCHFGTGTDKINASPGLDSLKDNGGPTKTRALLTGSPAIDAIPQTSCTDQSGTPQPVTTDQRGLTRPDNGESSCDIGAYESWPPTASIGSPAGGAVYALGQSVATSFSCSEESGGPMVSSCTDSNGAGGGSGHLDTSTAGSHTYTVTATATDGEASTASISYTVDGTAPSISVSAPTDGATYTQGQVVAAAYSCIDPDGAGDVASCSGPVASGGRIVTSTTGPHSFTVTAADKAGNTASRTVHYTIAAGAPIIKTSGRPSAQRQGSTILVNTGITVICPAGGGPCTASETAAVRVPASAARAKAKRVLIGRATFMIPAGRSRKITFKLNAAGARLLRKLGSLRVTVTVAARVGHNKPITATRTFTIKPSPSKHRRR